MGTLSTPQSCPSPIYNSRTKNSATTSARHFRDLAYRNPMALTLSNNRMIGGVCGGLAEWLGWDPTLVRILYTVLTIFTIFSGAIVYLILWIIMPKKS